jgi:hypothetical protein
VFAQILERKTFALELNFFLISKKSTPAFGDRPRPSEDDRITIILVLTLFETVDLLVRKGRAVSLQFSFQSEAHLRVFVAR